METQAVTPAMLRQKMRRHGITQRELAEESGCARPNVTAILNHSQYVSQRRLSRLQDALHALIAEKQAEARAKAAAAGEAGGEGEAATPQPEPRIRLL